VQKPKSDIARYFLDAAEALAEDSDDEEAIEATDESAERANGNEEENVPNNLS